MQGAAGRAPVLSGIVAPMIVGCHAAGYSCGAQTVSPYSTPCAAGTFSNATGFFICAACPVGSYSTAQATSCVLCEAGRYSATAARGGQCLDCPPGAFSAGLGATECLHCAAGSVTNSSQAASHCVACLPGFFAAGSTTACAACSPGSFSNTSAASACLVCRTL